MRKLRVFIPAALVVCLALPVVAAPQEDPRKQVDTAIAEAIRLLEAQQYVEFVKAFAPPEAVARMTQQTTIEELAKGMAGERTDALLQALRQIKGTTPTMEAEGRVARFTLKEPVKNKATIAFEKIGDYWYIAEK
jgi:hypothetical protein